MATIALYANKINQMPEIINNVKNSVTNFKTELSGLWSKSLTINTSVCNMDDIISFIQTSSQTQEQKISSLETFSNNSEEFISETARIDGEAADIIKQRKDDFYDQYYYLKPECEKSRKEKIGDDLESVGEWCKEHWKLIVTGVIVVISIALIWTGVGGMLGAMALGALWGAGIGGAIGGVMSVLQGGSFFEGFENGAFSGAIAGIISGGMGFGFTGGVKGVLLTFRQTLLIGGVSGAGTSLYSDLGDIFIKGENISLGQILFNMGISGGLGVVFAGIGYGIFKGFSALKAKVFKPSLKPGTLSNKEARLWYLEQEAKIPSMIDDSLTLEEQAKQAAELRNLFRTQARELMADTELADFLNRTEPNLTWDQLVARQEAKGLKGNEIYKAIIESSQKSRQSVNKSLGIE